MTDGCGPRMAGLDDLEVTGRRVLVRVDFNVPLAPDGSLRDDTRIRASLATIDELRRRGARTILLTHLGRPHGRPDPSLAVAPVARRLGELLGVSVATAQDCVGPLAAAAVERTRPGELVLLENLRFHRGEEANDPTFAAQVAALGDLFVNDAFGTAHRAHASTVGVPALLPAVAGRLMAKELEQLGALFAEPRRPLVAVVGGSKLTSKLALLAHLVDRVDALCLGGAMASTFLVAAGAEVGTSLTETDAVDQAADLVRHASDRGVDLRLPVDVVVAADPEAASATVATCDVRAIPADRMLLDIGPDTVGTWAPLLASAGTVVWNGPLGLYERTPFASGTQGVAEAILAGSATTVIGGGDLAAALRQLGLLERFDHVSTGGGATLEFLEGRVLPGVAALCRAGDPALTGLARTPPAPAVFANPAG